MQGTADEDVVDPLLEDQSDPAPWLLTVGAMALAITPISLILGGIWGAISTNAGLILVWLASIVWVRAQRGSLGSARVLPSAIMMVAWPAISALFAITA